ncbi:MAG: 4-hydroxybenzoate octaprenyltransferase [Hyphomicrobium sp.]
MKKPLLIVDAPQNNWVDNYTPKSWHPYLRLMRLDRPIGTWLLLYPCWWSVLLANMIPPRMETTTLVWLLLLFAGGAVTMRGAGCAYNDFIDRDFDAKVTRTANRPIASGQISHKQTVILIFVLSMIGLGILLQLNQFSIILGASSTLLVLVYPFMKRVTNWPQLFLGLVFNWGALLGWSAVKGDLSVSAFALYVGAVLWTIGYDTIYAHQDAKDDVMLNLKSTALRFGEKSATWVGGFYFVAVVCWGIAGLLADAQSVFFLSLLLVGLQFVWQVFSFDPKDPAKCLQCFRSNKYVGAALFIGLLTDLILR